MKHTYYLFVEDFVQAEIGPFDTPQAAMAHYEWTKQQGDAAVFIAVVVDRDRDGMSPDCTMTPQEDIEEDRNTTC